VGRPKEHSRQGRRQTPQQFAAATQSHEPPPRFALALLVGIVGICANSLLVPYVGFYQIGSHLGVDYLPIGVFCLFVILIALNGLLRRVGFGLRRRELLIAYMAMLVTSAIPGSGFAVRLIPLLPHAFYHSTEVNNWNLIFQPNLPSWAIPHGMEVVSQFYENTDGGPIPWAAWFMPLATWLVPWGGMIALMIGLGILLRRRWLEQERLTFPLVQIPLAVIGDEAEPTFNRELRRDAVFWVAFLIPFLLRLLDGLHFYFPAVPNIPIGDLGSWNELLGVDEPGWKDLFDTTRMEIHLALVGIAILMRQEVSASFWFFQWFYLGVGALMTIAGYGMGQHTYTPQETFGYVMFIYYARLGGTFVAAAMLFWAAREHIARAWQLALRPWRASVEDDYLLRWVVWLILGGAVLYLGWAHAGGMELKIALFMLTIHVAVLVVLARIIADGGLFWVSLSLDPMRSVVRFLGTNAMSGKTLTMMALSNHVPMASRANLLPSIMDSFKLGERTAIGPSKVVRTLVIAIVIATFAGLAAILWISYTYGASNLDSGVFLSTPGFPYDESAKYMQSPAQINATSIWMTVLGGALMAVFIGLHRRLVWWPIYPLGFAVAESATMEHMWLSVFIGWAIHVLIVRLGGGAGYRRIKPAAIGLVVGDFLAIGMWAAIDMMMASDVGLIGNRMTHEISTW
jgi:hypothetical protein